MYLNVVIFEIIHCGTPSPIEVALGLVSIADLNALKKTVSESRLCANRAQILALIVLSVHFIKETSIFISCIMIISNRSAITNQFGRKPIEKC